MSYKLSWHSAIAGQMGDSIRYSEPQKSWQTWAALTCRLTRAHITGCAHSPRRPQTTPEQDIQPGLRRLQFSYPLKRKPPITYRPK